MDDVLITQMGDISTLADPIVVKQLIEERVRRQPAYRTTPRSGRSAACALHSLRVMPRLSG